MVTCYHLVARQLIEVCVLQVASLVTFGSVYLGVLYLVIVDFCKASLPDELKAMLTEIVQPTE